MISTLERQISERPLVCAPVPPTAGLGSVPGSLLARHGGRGHISARLCPLAGPSLGTGGFSPGSHPGSTPGLSLELGTRSSDAFDAGAGDELVTWMFLCEIPGAKQPNCFSLSAVATQGGSTAGPWRGDWARAVPAGQPWASCSASPCLSFPVCKMGTIILLYLTGWV